MKVMKVSCGNLAQEVSCLVPKARVDGTITSRDLAEEFATGQRPEIGPD